VEPVSDVGLFAAIEGTKGSSMKVEPVKFIDMGPGGPPYIPPNLWKAYGYWARPTVNEVTVHNASMLFLSAGSRASI
jgi:hypothetical protein